MDIQKAYLYSTEELCKYLNTDMTEGLNTKLVRSRLARDGENKLNERSKTPAWKYFVKQFKNFMVIILGAAALFSFLIGEYTDAITVGIILLLNAVLGFVQEYRADKSIQALQAMASPHANVIRNGFVQKISASQLVRGDIVMLEPGDIVPADGRVIEEQWLEISEAALTGESVQVRKRAALLTEETLLLANRHNMVYAGTTVMSGKGRFVVCAVGSSTEIGKIADMLQSNQFVQTPLEHRLEVLGRKLGIGCLLICLVVSLLGIMKGESILLMCMSGISLAVAIIPEGLPAIVTVALALGMQRMVKKQALIRRLPAVETLGCVNVICSDKTGTLTKNEMTVRQIYLYDKLYAVSGEGYDIRGRINGVNELANDEELAKFLTYAVLCNNSVLQHKNISFIGKWRDKRWTISGDPTEGALLVAAAKLDLWQNELHKRYQRCMEIPFSSERAMMSVIYTFGGKRILIIKGAVDKIMARCSFVSSAGKVVGLTDTVRARIMAINSQLADDAMRVLAVSWRYLADNELSDNRELLENNLVFCGLAGMIDPPRDDAAASIKKCHAAGIRTIMITGDQANTALAIARQIALTGSRQPVLMTGEEIEACRADDFMKRLRTVNVFARVSPHHKMKIVSCLQQQGAIVAMTGDGVNDAPAVRKADIGICMGNTGTDITREFSDMILLDERFSVIVDAIEEGRSIYANIRKFIRYLLACNTGEVLVMLLASLLGLPLPLLPVQVLWVNLITDGFPALALGVDANSSELMERPPRRKRETVFAGGLSRKIIIKGIEIGVGSLAVFWLVLEYMHDLEMARTMCFTTLVFSQMFHVFECRSECYSGIEAGLFKNHWLVAAVLCSAGLHAAVLYLPFMQQVFITEPLSLHSWLLIIAVSGWSMLWGIGRYAITGSRSMVRQS